MQVRWNCLALAAMAFTSTAQAAPAPSAKKGDPNEVVCERIGTIGTRLRIRKVCATRAEWDEKRRLDRDAVDQAQRSANGPCSSTLTHTGAPAC
jgi:hypothetical protein